VQHRIEGDGSTERQRAEGDHLAPLDAAPNDLLAVCGSRHQLQFGHPARPQPSLTLDQRAVWADVHESDQQPGPEDRVRMPAGMCRTGAPGAPAFRVGAHGSHAALAGSNRSTRTRPVLPVMRMAICGPPLDAT